MCLENTEFGRTILKRLSDQESNHGALMDAVASLSASLAQSIQSRPPLPPPPRTQNLTTSTPIALQKKRSHKIVHEVEEEDQSFEDVEEDYQRKEHDYQNRIRHSDRRIVEFTNSVEDTMIAEFQKTEETLERCRRDNRLNAILAKLRYMKR